eukprot:2882469-Pleurochrysis_carterae.AAC.1
MKRQRAGAFMTVGSQIQKLLTRAVDRARIGLGLRCASSALRETLRQSAAQSRRRLAPSQVGFVTWRHCVGHV